MSLLIGIHIKDILGKNEELSERVGNRIYPLVIPVGVPKYPFIVYRNDGTSPDYTKDGTNEDTVSVNVAIVAKEYSEAVEIAQAVRYSLEDKRKRYDKFEVRDSILTGTMEEWLDDIDAIGITLSFSMKTIDL